MPLYHDNVSRAEKAAGALKNGRLNGGVGDEPASMTSTPEEITALRLHLHGNGYHPVPIVGIHVTGVNSPGKQPRMPNWQVVCPQATPQDIEGWIQKDPDCVNTGIACDNLAGVDIDILDPQIAAERVARARELFGPTPLIRIGRAPKTLLVYRIEAPHDKFSTQEMFFGDDVDNKDMKVQVEFLGCHRQQFVAFGLHPDTREQYQWPDKSPLDIPWDDVPLVKLEDLQHFKAETEQAMRAAGARSRSEIQDEIRERESHGGEAAGIHDGEKPTRAKVEDALNHIPNDVDRGTYINIGFAVYEALGESGWSLFDGWARQYSSYNKNHTTSDWRSFRKGRKITVRTLFWHAAQRGWRSKDASSANGKSKDGPRAGAEAKPEPPRPLIRELPPADLFPIDALGDVLGDAAKGIHDRVQSPPAICGQSVLAVATLAVQGYANIELPTGQKNPLSSFFITVAASGERKSATDTEALWPVAKHENALREKYAVDYPKYEDEQTAWDKAKEHLIKKAKGDRAEIRSALVNLGPPPVAPLTPLLTCPEPTFEGLCKHLVLGQPGIGIFSDEGGMFIGGHGMNPEAKLRTAAGLSGLWDGKPIKRIRAVDGTTILPGRRCSLHLMCQPDVAAKMLSDPELLDQGLLSRCLVTAPETNSGSRLWHEPDAASDSAIKRYGGAILKILELPLPLVEGKANELSPRTVTLSQGAVEMWKNFSDSIEVQLKPDGKLASIRGLANKLPEHAARLAAVLTLVEDIWHTTFPTAILAYALSKDVTGVATLPGRSTMTSIVTTVVCVLAVIAGLTWIVTAKTEYLPSFYTTDVRLQTRFGNQVNFALWLWVATALAVLIFRRRTILDLWLMVTLLAWMPNFLVAALSSSVRFSVGWYAVRGFVLIASCMVLTGLLIETTFLYSRLASAIILQRRERTNRLLSVDAVTAAIAHELRTPLGAIALNASTALSQLRSNPPELEEMDDVLSDIEADSHRAGAMISSIRELSKKTTDRRALTRVEDVARLSLRLLQHDLQINEVSVATEFEGNLPEVHLDGTQIQQVLLNLVKNAIDAMNSVPPEARRLRLTTSFDGHSTVLLSVEDSGPGIPVEDRERIFDPFFTTKSGGMGLGLAISSTLVANYGGKLRLVKSDSAGSIFQIAIPVGGQNSAE